MDGDGGPGISCYGLYMRKVTKMFTREINLKQEFNVIFEEHFLNWYRNFLIIGHVRNTRKKKEKKIKNK